MTFIKYVEIGLIVLSMLLLGFAFGFYTKKRKRDGIIIIEPTEDGERERIRFVLNYDLEDLKALDQVTFKVENNISKNIQVL